MARALGKAPSGGGAMHVGALPPAGLFLLVVLSIAWGVNWPMMKLALQDIPVWTFRTLCLMIGGSTLLLLTRFSGQAWTLPRDKVAAVALVSLFNITGWHLCSAYGLLHTGGGRAAIISFTMPLWTSIFSIYILKTKPSVRQVLALICGMAALATLLANDLRTLGGAPLGVIFMLLASLNWGLGTILVKKINWNGVSVMALTGWQQLIGGAPIVVGWWLLEPVPDFSNFGMPALVGLGYAVFIAMVFCHTAYFKLVSLLPAHVAAMGIMAVPVVGVVSAALILGETIGWSELLALAFVVSSMVLLMRPGGPAAQKERS